MIEDLFSYDANTGDPPVTSWYGRSTSTEQQIKTFMRNCETVFEETGVSHRSEPFSCEQSSLYNNVEETVDWTTKGDSKMLASIEYERRSSVTMPGRMSNSVNVPSHLEHADVPPVEAVSMLDACHRPYFSGICRLRLTGDAVSHYEDASYTSFSRLTANKVGGETVRCPLGSNHRGLTVYAKNRLKHVVDGAIRRMRDT